MYPVCMQDIGKVPVEVGHLSIVTLAPKQRIHCLPQVLFATVLYVLLEVDKNMVVGDVVRVGLVQICHVNIPFYRQ